MVLIQGSIIGYLAVLITAFIPIAKDLQKTKIGLGVFEIRLDHLLHLFVYFLICLYYLVGQWEGFKLFNANSLIKFILLILLLASFTELVQLWVPERAFSLFDLVSNYAGVMIGVVVIKTAQRRKRHEDITM